MPKTQISSSGQRFRPSQPEAGQRRIYNPDFHELVFGILYAALMSNLAFLLATLPLVVLLVATDLTVTWPLLVLFGPLFFIALGALFTVLRNYNVSQSIPVFRTFFGAWKRFAWRASALGIGCTVIVAIAVVNLRYFATNTFGPLVVPFQIALIVTLIGVTITALVALPELPEVRLADVVKRALLCSVRRWYLTLAALIVLVLWYLAITLQPAIGIGVLTAPLLYAVWALCRYALRPAIPQSELSTSANT